MSKAFDKVWHEGLLFKLKQNGINDNILKLMSSYLNSRKQRVVLNGMNSDWDIIESGVPQGSVLGPLLFLIYINDLEKDIKSSIKFFADDTMLYSIVNDPNITANDLNHDLKLIEKWAHQWKMAFNPDPTKQAIEVLFSQKKSKIDHPPLFFNSVQVQRENYQKHLGLILDSKLTFSHHIKEKTSKVRKGIGLIKYLSSFAPTKTLDQIYKMYIRPHLDYCDVIFDTPAKISEFDHSVNLSYLMNSIERLQYQAALAVTGCWQGTSTYKVYEELGWESLSDRRFTRRLIQFFKIFNYNSPPYLYENIPPLRIPIYGTDSPRVFREIFCRTDKYMNSFFPNSVKSWNNIDNSIRNSETIGIFKKKLYSLIRPPKKPIFGILNSSGIKHLYKLR